jgi:hypothetical protein
VVDTRAYKKYIKNDFTIHFSQSVPWTYKKLEFNVLGVKFLIDITRKAKQGYGLKYKKKWNILLTSKDPWVFGCKTTQNYPF